jgi:hypothetical protein
VARRQVDQLGTPAVQKGVEADEKRIGPLTHKRCEGRIDLATGAGIETWICGPMARAGAATQHWLD